MSPTSSQILRILPNGLVLRRSTRADAERLAEFDAEIHSDTDQPDLKVADWIRDLLGGSHPTFAEDDFTIVEDPETGKIVSSMNLISQTWSYAGIPFKVGRPELVGTDPAYRNRGLVRQQFEIVHEWSRQRGELVQGITGIPFYYRQFGYEMTVNLGGGRVGSLSNLPELAKDQPEPYTVRPALAADLALIARLDQEGSKRYLISTLRNEALWRYELSGQRHQNVNRNELRIIQNSHEEPIGYLAHPPFLWDEMQAATELELAAGVSYLDTAPSVIRYLWRTGEEHAREENKTLKAFGFWLGENHPLFQVAQDRLPRLRRPYAWYLRVPDLPAFLHLIRPVLEERLNGSPVSGYSGEVKIGFYRSGILLKFTAGKLETIETWQPATKNFGKAAFPGLTFLQLLFGYRSLDEIRGAFPDCFCSAELEPVLQTLFPKQASDIWPIN